MLARFFRGSRPRQASDCTVCGHRSFVVKPVLWTELIDAWQLSIDEVRYINLQQGQFCQRCLCNLRSRTLAGALLDHFGFNGTLEGLCRRPNRVAGVRLLEINEAGGLSPWLRKLPGHHLAEFPNIDMQALPYAESSWNVILHSDVLEHIPSPMLALEECHRILAADGVLIYTIPIVHGRLTRTRENLSPSYHGDPHQKQADWRVYSEYGANFWLEPMAAGFRKITLFSLFGPESLALICEK